MFYHKPEKLRREFGEEAQIIKEKSCGVLWIFASNMKLQELLRTPYFEYSHIRSLFSVKTVSELIVFFPHVYCHQFITLLGSIIRHNCITS